MENIIKGLKVTQNNQEFLLGVFKMRQIRNFTRYTERLIVGYKDVVDEKKVYDDLEQKIPDYNPQIQRKTNNAKVERIADFLINDVTAMFPTNIVIAIPQEVIDTINEDESGNVEITLNPIVKNELAKKGGDVFLTIIDGQHRIKGVERAIERVELLISEPKEVENKAKNTAILQRLLNLELIVTFFVDPILEYQAMIFSIINKTQTKVPENLVFSLFGLTKEDTPQKTSLEVVLALNGLEKSPFYNRIKLVGKNYVRGQSIPLSQATMVKSILFNICKNQRESEIERNLKRSALIKNPNLLFREYYSKDSDKTIVRIMYSFFSAVRDTFKNDEGISFWTLKENQDNLNVLQTNVGYQALMKILIDLLKVIPDSDKDNKLIYTAYLTKAIDIDFDDQEKKYPFTSKSINILYADLKSKIID